MDDRIWSKWYPFDDKKVLTILPNKPGVYEVYTDYEFGRLHGNSSLVTIGRAEDMKKRREQKASDPNRYLNRAEKWLYKHGHVLEFRYCVCRDFEDAKFLEATSLWEYESRHWELPPGNDRLEKPPIIERIKENFGSVEQLLQELDKGLSHSKAASKLGVSTAIIEDLVVYYRKNYNKSLKK